MARGFSGTDFSAEFELTDEASAYGPLSALPPVSGSPGALLGEILGLTARGWAFPARGSLYAAILEAMAGGLSALEQAAEAAFVETDPRTASECIGDWERLLGPDPCGRDLSLLGLGRRRELAHQRLTATGGASIPYFVELAARRGFEIEITENRCSMTGGLQCGDELILPPEQFNWTVSLPFAAYSIFEAGDNTAGDRLYDISLSDLECDIRRLKPAHTDVTFRYI